MVFKYRGNQYSFDPESAFRLRGWIPWHKYRPWVPWSIVIESSLNKKMKIGLLVYREPKEPSKVPIAPAVAETVVKLLTPEFEKSVILNPHLRNYRRRQKFQSTGMGFIAWGLIGILLIIGLLILMGQVHIGG